MKLYRNIDNFISKTDISSISPDRIETLNRLAAYIKSKNGICNLIFICTHNSRRSVLAQVWAQVFAYHFGLKDIFCYSGGTEATAVYSKIIDTLMETGFSIMALSEGSNPLSVLKYSDTAPPIILFSKIYNHFFNPKKDFVAVMTCSEADANCPLVLGAEKRISVTYDDPKLFDNTALQTKKYRERNIQIATEMYFVFSQIKQDSSVDIK